MAIVLKDRVKQSAAAPGTGTITLGATTSGFQAFSAIGNGNVTYFAIVDPTSGAWEVNYGTYTASGTTLSRNATPLSSSAAGALVNFTGTVDVFCTYPSSKAIYEETNGNVLIDGGPITIVGNGVTSYTTFSAALGELYANINNFAQFYAQNLNTGSEASGDFVAYRNDSTGTTKFVDLGINSSNYSSVSYPIFTAGSAYLFNNTGEMFIGSETDDLILFAGGVATTDWAARIDKTSKLITTKAALTLGGALTGIGGSFTSPVTTTSSMATPGATELVTKTYVDNATSSALIFHTAVQAASVSAFNEAATVYNNGTAGVGATLTRVSSFITFVIDGYFPSVNQRVLIKDQTTQTWNGVYTVTTVGSPSVGFVLTRATDADTAGSGANLLSLNDYFYVQNGTVNKGTAYVLSAPSGTITFGTSNIQFAEFSSSQIYTGTSPINVTSTVISLTTVPATLGGTGTATVTTGDLLYGSGTNTWAKLPAGAGYRALTMNAGGTQVEWNAVALNQSNAVSGSLPATNGGTGLNAYNVGEMIYSNTTTTFDVVTRNTTTTKKFLTQTGTGSAAQAPNWDVVNGADVNGNITGSAGSVANALTLGTYLTGTSYNGSSAVTAAVDATNLNTASKVVARDASGNFSAGTITAALSGNATTATTASSVTNALSAGTGLSYSSGTTFDGSVARTLNLANTAVTAGSYTTANITVDAQGRITAAANGSGGGGVTSITGTASQITASASTGAVTLSLPATINVNTSGNAATATTSAALTATTWQRIRGDTITQGSYGSISVSGTNGGYAGINFSDPYITLMANTGSSGFYVNNNTWRGYWDGSGNLLNTGNVTAYSSDERLKKNWAKIKDPISIVRAIGGWTFDWDLAECNKWDFYPPASDIGVSAQTTQKFFPTAVHPAPFDKNVEGKSKSGKEYLTVQYERLVPVLLAAVEEQADEIDTLKLRLDKLEQLLKDKQ